VIGNLLFPSKAILCLVIRKMNVDLGIWSKLTRFIVFLLVLTALMGIALWYLPLIKKNEGIRKQKLLLEQQIKLEMDTQKQLLNSIRALQEDPRALERMARETLGYAKTNETVIRFGPPPLTNAALRRPAF
jgi:cell division protein FtsB